MAVQCNGPINGRRKIFWTTQAASCGVVSSCVGDCGSTGLETYIPLGTPDGARTIRTNDYVLGLALNILMTDGRKEDTPCGHRPGARGGHWSDSFRDDGQSSGTNIRYIAPQRSIADTVKLIQAHMQNSLNKLVTYGVANLVTVKTSYAGRGVIAADIEILGNDGQSARVGVTGKRIENSWVWGTE